MESKIAGPIEEVSEALNVLVDSLLPQDSTNYLTQEVDIQLFSDKHTVIEDVLLKNNVDYQVKVPSDQTAQEETEKVEKYNQDIDQKTRDLIISFGFQRCISSTISTYLSQQKESQIEGLLFYNKVAILLDFQAHLFTTHFPYIKHSYYESLSQVLRLLLAVSTSEIERFWEYMESRESLFQNKLFDRGVVADRISLLEICNGITDKYIYRNSKGHKDLRKKDTFNDTFQYRVRVFLSKIFAFDDNTGLNKYFHVSNRESPAFPKVRSAFLEDIIYIQRVFNDPYFYLKKATSSEIKALSDGIQSVSSYLLDEEAAFQRTVKSDIFAVVKEKPESEKQLLREKYSDLWYFPETYWVLSFSHESKQEYDRLKEEDREYFNDQFGQSKVRCQYLVMIYFIANFLFEMTPKNKSEFLASIPSNVKHITDDSLPESYKNFFFKIKKDIFNLLKTVDSLFAFVLQHMAVSEKIWWSWLIYGKDPKTNKSLFVDKLLSHEELTKTQQDFEKAFPFKGKKYFNTYVTPQLSRKMKGPRGLSRLEKKQDGNSEKYAEALKQLSDKIDVEEDQTKRNELLEERNAVIWKNSKIVRQGQWFDLGNVITPKTLMGRDLPEEKSEEEKEKEKEEEEVNGKEGEDDMDTDKKEVNLDDKKEVNLDDKKEEDGEEREVDLDKKEADLTEKDDVVTPKPQPDPEPSTKRAHSPEQEEPEKRHKST